MIFNVLPFKLFGFVLQALYLNCPELNDLNLNSCTNLHPGNYPMLVVDILYLS